MRRGPTAQEYNFYKATEGWQEVINGLRKWQKLVRGVEGEYTPSGVVYDLPDYKPGLLGSFAIVDLREIGSQGGVDEPHYHRANEGNENGETEIHFPIAGSAIMAYGRKSVEITRGERCVIAPLVGHFAVPDPDYVVGVVNLPKYSSQNYVAIDIAEKLPAGVSFSTTLYSRMTAQK